MLEGNNSKQCPSNWRLDIDVPPIINIRNEMNVEGEEEGGVGGGGVQRSHRNRLIVVASCKMNTWEAGELDVDKVNILLASYYHYYQHIAGQYCYYLHDNM